MIIGIMMPGFGHVYCGATGKGLFIFFMFFFILIGGGLIALFTLGIGLLIALALVLLLDIYQLIDVKHTVDRYNAFVRTSGRPPY